MIRWLAAWSGWLATPSGPALGELRTGAFVALDFETTGLDTRRDAIVSVAAIPFVDGTPRDGYETLVHPGRPIPAASSRVHGITDADVAGAPTIDAVLPALDAVLADHVIVGHDIAFDLAILRRDRRARRRPRVAHLFLDTRGLAAALHRRWQDLELESLVAHLGLPMEARHTARGDALMAGRVLLTLLPDLLAHGVRTVPEAMALQRS